MFSRSWLSCEGHTCAFVCCSAQVFSLVCPYCELAKHRECTLCIMDRISLNNNSVFALCVALIVRHCRRRRCRQRKYWIHPIIRDRSSNGQFVLLHNKLKDNQENFFEYYRMSVRSFEMLFCMVRDTITKTNIRLRECIVAEQKLALTLRWVFIMSILNYNNR